MLNNIKSYFFNRLMFSFIEKLRKLKILKYNKTLQNRLDINIKHYIFNSGRYIIYDSKGKGKEYNGYIDSLIYEGEYLNGERNGKGKEYDNLGNLIYEGDFKNGKRDGQGKLYKNKILFYEGEFKKGKRNGKGKSFMRGKLSFEGEFSEDELRNGNYYDGEGNIKKGFYNGNGYRKLADSLGNIIFEGEYLNWKANGKIKQYYQGTNILSFEGEYLNGVKNGKGIEHIYIGNIYLKFEGEYLNGKRKKGKIYYKDGSLFLEAEYLNGIIWNAKFYVEDKVECEIKSGKGKKRDIFNNQGNKLTFIEVDYLNGEANGKGKIYDENGVLLFEGEFSNNKRKGKGKEYNEYGELIFDGEYLDGHKIKGKEFIEGKLEFEGEYLYDRKFNGKGFYQNGNKIYELINGNGNVIIYYNDESSIY